MKLGKLPRKTSSAAAAAKRAPRTIGEFAREPSTWAGLLAIASAIATGGATALTNPALLSTVGSGLALILTREG